MSKREALIKLHAYEDGMLWGEVFGHSKFPDGSYVHTSRVLKIKRISDSILIAETLNTYFRVELTEHFKGDIG